MILLIGLLCCVALAYMCFVFWLGLKLSDELDHGLLGIIAYFSTLAMGVAIPIQIGYWLGIR